MKLWYILIDLERSEFDIDYCYEFTKHTRFISNYLSKRIRKHRFDTRGEFNMISVRLGSGPISAEIVFGDILEVTLPFDKPRYEETKGTPDCGYYLEMFEEGFRKAAEFKKIPLQSLLDLIDEFRANGCKNEWLHKKKRFAEHDLEVALNCYFTTLEFKLVVAINKISTKKKLCGGIVLRTEPNEICFEKKFKDVLINDENIIITDFIDKPRILIDLKEALEGNLVFELLPYEFQDSQA